MKSSVISTHRGTLIAVFVCIATAVGSASAFFGSPANGIRWLAGHEYSITPAVLDFGVVSSAKPLEGELTIQNLTFEKLSIVGGGKSCSCIALENFPVHIAPGSSKSLNVTFHPSSQEGSVNQSISLYCIVNGTTKDVVVPVEAHVVAPAPARQDL